MKKQLFVSLVIVMLYLAQNPVIAQKIYLSPAGNDNNPGTMEKPLATLCPATNKTR